MLCILIRYVVSPGPGELARYVVEVYTGVAPVLATEPNGVKPAIGELYLDVTKLAWTTTVAVRRTPASDHNPYCGRIDTSLTISSSGSSRSPSRRSSR